MNLPAVVSPFFSTNWKPAAYRQVKNENHKLELAGNGYFVCENFFSPETIQKLTELYNEHQHIGTNDIGMFVSAYSKDIDYRKQVHEKAGKIMEPELDAVFENYQPAAYNFAIKKSFPEHELPIHHDLALIDEQKSSPLNIWLPLTEVIMENGPVCVVPKTQYFFPPYRSNFTDHTIFQLSAELKKYAVPLCLKPGDLLVFDSRLIHYSMPNASDNDRVAVISYIYPDDISFLFMSKSKSGGEFDFDLFELQRDDFFVNVDFEKAEESGLSGISVGNITMQPFTVSEEQLHRYFSDVGVSRAIREPEKDAETTGNQNTDSLLKRIVKRFFSSGS